jgi:death on curing protein
VAHDHALVDGNERLALAAVIAFLGINGHRLIMTNDEAYELVMAVAAGEHRAVDVIAERLRAGSAERHAPGR